MTWLEDAKKLHRRGWENRWDTDECMELALAWARGEVSVQQVSMAIHKKPNGNVYVALSNGLRRYAILKDSI